MRAITVLLLLSSVALNVLPHPLHQVTLRNISVRHEKRKRIKSDLIYGLQPNSDEPTHRRNLHKHILINNKTMQILGERVQQILKDGRKWAVKDSSNKSFQHNMNFEKILQDKRNDLGKKSINGRDRIHSALAKGRSSELNSEKAIERRRSSESIPLPINSFEKDSETDSSAVPVGNWSSKTEKIAQSPVHFHESHFHTENNNPEMGPLTPEASQSGKALSNFHSSNLTLVRNDSKDDINYDFSYDLEMLNLRGYTSNGNQLSGVLRDLLDRLSNSDRETNQDPTPPCQMWADCRWKLQEVLIRSLPSCPCTYPSAIFYDDSLWDKNTQRFYRWKDASGASERLDVYKLGAKHCVRSIATDLYSIAAQHCCYDSDHMLLTRGSGAGSPNLVSPDISSTLHYRIDILPWHHCKGDFTRYNKVRPPNNGNNCMENPNEAEYLRQVETATSF